MNRNIKILLGISINVCILMLIGLLWVNSIRETRIKSSEKVQIKIIRSYNENILIEEKDIKELLFNFYKKDYRKIPSYALKEMQLEQAIKNLDAVQKVEIFQDALNHMHIDVFQRNPIVRVVDVAGNHFYLDSEGKKIPVNTKYPIRVPVSTGNLAPINTKELTAKDKFYYKSLLVLAQQINQDSFSKSLVEQIVMDENGEFTLIPKIGSERILIGNIEMVSDKLDRLKLFYKENMGRQGWNVYHSINLKYKGQIIGKKNKFYNET